MCGVSRPCMVPPDCIAHVDWYGSRLDDTWQGNNLSSWLHQYHSDITVHTIPGDASRISYLSHPDLDLDIVQGRVS